MRVLLINSNTKDDMLAAPPIGISYVAESTEFAGHQVKVVDLCFSGKSLRKDLESGIRSFEPSVVGLSIRNIDNANMLHPVSYLPSVKEIAAHIRDFTSAPLVLGGSGASLMPEAVLRFLGADYIVVAEGEHAFVQLLEAMESGDSGDDIPGVGMILDGEFHMTPPAYAHFSVPRPQLGKWIGMSPYLDIGGAYNIQTKRGCSQKCIYCTYNRSLEGNKLRLRDPIDVVDEIEEALGKYSPDSFEFVDSVFNDPIGHAKEILEEIVRRPWKADFTTMGVSPRHVDDELLDLMWRAGFRSFMITPEAASETMIGNYGKGFVKDDVIKAAESINRTSFAAWWFFMIGGPGETNETLQESLDFALKYLRNDGRPVRHVADFFLGVRVYPGTTLWDIAMRDGFITKSVNPLEPLWYLSRDLDLDRALAQMEAAALQRPEIYLGFDEWLLLYSKTLAFLLKTFKVSKPYWKHFPVGNSFGLKTGIRFLFRPKDLAQSIRDSLSRQGVTTDPPQDEESRAPRTVHARGS